MTRRLLPLLVLAVAACDAPEGACEGDPEQTAEALDLAEECGFAEEYAGEVYIDGTRISATVRKARDRNVWSLLGVTQGGQLYGVEIHPRDCGGEFGGEWSGEHASASAADVRFAGRITADAVEFDRFTISEASYVDGEPSFPSYETGLVLLPVEED